MPTLSVTFATSLRYQPFVPCAATPGRPSRAGERVYAFMQNVGVVNDHIHGCFRATDHTQRPTKA
jgi:hypothetical protein